MVKVMGNLNRWVTKEYLQEMLGWSPENIDLLVNGLSKSVAVAPNNLILINLNDLRSYLVSVKEMADPILDGSASKKIKKPRDVSERIAPKTSSKMIKKQKKERMSRRQRVAAGQLTGKQVAQKLNCRYSDIHELIEKYGLKAGKFGRGYYIKQEDLEEFLSSNQDVVNSLQFPQKQAVSKEPEIIPEDTEQEEKRTEAPIQEEKEENPEDDMIMPSFPGLPDLEPEGEKPKEEDLPKDAIEIRAPAEENTGSGSDQVTEKDQTSEKQEPVQAEEKEKKSAEADSGQLAGEEKIPKEQATVPEIKATDASVKEDKKEPRILSYVTIKKCRYGCKTDDVASALGLSIFTPIKWIKAEAVKAVSNPGPRGEDWYIEPESLRDFLIRERNTLVTFSETKISKQMGSLMPASPR